MRVVLDSNIAIAAMNKVPAVVERLANMPADDVGIPIVAIAELAYGARRSRRVEEDAVLVTADRSLLDGAIPGLRSEDWLERP